MAKNRAIFELNFFVNYFVDMEFLLRLMPLNIVIARD